MNENKCICDRCHVELKTGVYPRTPSGWKNIRIELSQYNHKNYDLCGKCLEELGLIAKDGGMEKIESPSIEKRVFEILYDIAKMATEDSL